MKLVALLAALLGLLQAAPARACSSSSDYVAPSNFELVQMAEAIGIYVAEPAPPAGPAPVNPGDTILNGFGDPMVLRLERGLMGAPPAEMSIFLGGIIEPQPPEPELAELAFRYPNYGGGCTRHTFERGARYLMILRRERDGQWYPVHFGGNRAMEDYGSDNAPWPRTVRRYLALRALRPAAQTAALIAMRDSGRDRDGTLLLSIERDDITHHLRAPSQWKPTAWLLERYARAVRGEPVDIVLEGPIQFNQLRGDRAHTLLTSLANGQHPGARPLFERLAEAPGSSGRDLALALRYFSGNGDYARAWRWIETRLAYRLLTLDTLDAQILLREVDEVQRGGNYEPGHERWRRVPRVAAAWPEIALSLYWYQVGRMPPGDRQYFDDAIETIPVSDYRTRPLLSVALAAADNERALAWASAELAGLPVPADETGEEWQRDRADERAFLPARMLVTHRGEQGEAPLIRAFCQGGVRRRTIINAFRRWGDPDYHDLLGRMATYSGLTALERSRALQAVMEMSARGLDHADAGVSLGSPDSQWLLTRLLRGQAREGEPLTCPA